MSGLQLEDNDAMRIILAPIRTVRRQPHRALWRQQGTDIHQQTHCFPGARSSFGSIQIAALRTRKWEEMKPAPWWKSPGQPVFS
jgi:hypothetical protein